MNRLRFMTAYLVGPMDHDRESGKEWRDVMGPWLHEEKNCIVVDPYDKPMKSVSAVDALEDEANHQKVVSAIATKTDEGYDFAEEKMKVVRSTDLRIVDHAAFEVVNLDLDKRPCGTYDELFMGNSQKKPIITMCPQGKSEVPPWLFGTYPHRMMFDSWGNVQDYLDYIDTAPDSKIETLGRWVFFDFEQQIRNIMARIDK